MGGARVAAGKDFEEKSGLLKQGAEKVLHLDEAGATALAARLANAPFTVLKVEEKPVTRRPPPPLITSTLQQEANRKLGMSAKETMRVAQSLYERGLITYMRTDSVNLSEEALKAARASVAARFGEEFLSDEPRRYKTTSKGAQEAHEAIRPSADFTSPKELGLTGRDHDIYELIWMRTLATQMAEARQMQTSVRIEARPAEGEPALFSTSGMRIVFPGFLRAYVEGADDTEAALEEREKLLPALAAGDVLGVAKITPTGHETKPPPRYTEASLIQLLEKEGIGRPSTYATIVGTILDRGYAAKQGNQLVPTFTAFVVGRADRPALPGRGRSPLHLADGGVPRRHRRGEAGVAAVPGGVLPGRGRTAQPDRAAGRADRSPRQPRWCASTPRSTTSRSTSASSAPTCELKQGDGDPRKASIPEDFAPGDLSAESVHELLERFERRELGLGAHPESGKPVYLKTGIYGPYIQVGDAADDEKPKRCSLPPGIDPEQVDLALALRIAELPRLLGTAPRPARRSGRGSGASGRTSSATATSAR